MSEKNQTKAPMLDGNSNLGSQIQIEAPLWLKQRMEALRTLPPPTLKKVRAQFKASAEVRQKSGGKAKT